jgi:putative adenylate-forming enzyme
MSTTTAPPYGMDMATLQALGVELVARDRWPLERVLAYQRERLDDLLAHAVATSPYYREVLGASARGVPFEQLPTLSKATLVDQFDRIVTDPRLRRSDLERHANGPDAEAPYLGAYRVFSTSGTSGLRSLVVYSEEEFRFWVAVSLRVFARVGITPQTRLVAIGAPNPLHITRQLFAAFRSGRAGTPELSVLTPLDETVAALNTYQPQAIVCYASIASLLAQEQLEGRLRIAPHIVGVSAEVLTDEGRGWIREAWGVEVGQVYSSTETLYMASSVPPHRDLYVFDDLAVVEVVDEKNRPVPPGTPGYRVLVTNLVNRAQPLIRYEISDAVTLSDGPDSSRLAFARIAAVDGRSDDILRFPASGGGEVAVHPYRLREPFATLAEVRQYQIVQHERRLQVRIVLDRSAPSETTDRVRTVLHGALEDAGAVVPPLEVVPVERIEREPGLGAKLKLVKKL